jgi:predicted secreted Zn-dependent protease
VRFVEEAVQVAGCEDVGARGPENGLTTFRLRYEFRDVRRGADGRYTGKVTFTLGTVEVRIPRSIGWQNMSAADRYRAETLRRAIYHHEIGHVRIAEAVRDALNAHDAIVAPDVYAFGSAADALGRDGFARFKQEQLDYDELTDHGRRQHAAPGPLAGPDTVLVCR